MQLKVIGHIHSCFKEKFGTPKQPRLVPSAYGTIIFAEEFSSLDWLRGLEKESYIWLLFGFHLNKHQGGSPVVRPPLLGGNTKLGVFATRSPYRPNPIGMSLVKLIDIEKKENASLQLKVASHDLVDGTPIYDIKPYHPMDQIADAHFHWIDKEVQSKEVVIHSHVLDFLNEERRPELKELLLETLRLDPRPQYKNDRDEKIYHLVLDQFEFEWMARESIEVLSVEKK